MLADQGAGVIKVETPGTGDENRVWGTRAADGITSNFQSVNRGKRGITLNLKSEAARGVLRQLIARSDIVIQSFLPESAARLGVDYAGVRTIKPDIIYCSINGYGPQGELHNKAGYHLMMQAFKCKDGYLLVGATNDTPWRRFCDALGRNDLDADERFHTNDKRLEHRAVLVSLLEAIFATENVAHWISRFDAKGVAASPINTLDQVLVHPQVAANHMIVPVKNAEGRELPTLGVPFKLSGDYSTNTRAAPQLGADTDEVLRKELQMNEEEIARLREQGAL